MGKLLEKLGRTMRYYSLRFRRLRGSPHSLAMGAAIGATVGAAPTLPLNNILTLIFCFLLRGNPIAGILGATVYSNPLTFVPQYYFSWKIGNFFLPDRLTWERVEAQLKLMPHQGFSANLESLQGLGLDALLIMVGGGLFFALPIGLFTYLVVHRFYIKLQCKRWEKHLLNNHRKA